MTPTSDTRDEPIAGYRLIERLGAGGFGEVWKAEAPGGIYKAIKIIFGDIRSKDADTKRFAEQELKSLKRVQQVRHPYLLALDRYDIVDGRLMIVMELADCNLWDRFRAYRAAGKPGIPREELLGYMAEAAEVLDLMNDRFGLQHLDIKPQNLFLLYNHVKVADFGQVKDLEGMVTSAVTGGITPVYAAPETFDGIVTRYCDQYSLACVYQELLTGIRPFDGTSMQQLLMQHLHESPNVEPVPPGDRPVLLRALAKKPEDRFPSMTAMVAALRAGTLPGRTPSGTIPMDVTRRSTVLPAPAAEDVDVLRVRVTPPPVSTGPSSWEPPPANTVFPARIAPPEAVGDGYIRPALIVALGGTGQRVLRRFRQIIDERYGPPRQTPAVRTIYIDTDPEALTQAESAEPGYAALEPHEIVAARMNRPQHYLRPRLSGRTLIDGWMPHSTLYRLPRHPATMGLRAFGRLAFCDHYRVIVRKFQSELEAALDPAALASTVANTGLEARTNRPRVVIIAGLAGGTGSGMFLDVAYTLRAKLLRLGYTPDVAAILAVPGDGPANPEESLGRANTYAALTELNHFSRVETTFAADYDDRDATLRDPAPPFSRVYLIPLAPAEAPTTLPTMRPGSRTPGRAGSGSSTKPRSRPRPADPSTDPLAMVAEYLRLDLFSPVGRAIDDAHPVAVAGDSGLTLRTFAMTRFDWPRAEVVGQVAAVVIPAMTEPWTNPDAERVVTTAKKWLSESWPRLGLEPDALTAQFVAAVNTAVGGKTEEVAAALTAPLVPRGWLARRPEPEQVALVLDQLARLVGRPAADKPLSAVERAVEAAAEPIRLQFHTEMTKLLADLVESPQFRPAGAVAVSRLVTAKVEQCFTSLSEQAAEAESLAQAAFDLLTAYAQAQKGVKKPTAADFTEALRNYPANRVRAVTLSGAVSVYRAVRDLLADVTPELALHGSRLAEALARPALRLGGPSSAGERSLLPPGCSSPEAAAQVLLRSLSDADLNALEEYIQHTVQDTFGGFLTCCRTATDDLVGLARVVREAVRRFLDARLGEVDFGGMMRVRYGPPAAALKDAYEKAEPTLVGGGPWTRTELRVYAGPAGAGGSEVRAAALRSLPPGTIEVVVSDEAVIYREYPEVPLAALPQLGPQWESAYRAAPEAAHTRTDVLRWTDVDAG